MAKDIVDKTGYCSVHESYHCECYRPTKTFHVPEMEQPIGFKTNKKWRRIPMKKQSNPPPKAKHSALQVTANIFEIQKAFTEWDRRYREEPEKFQSEAEHLLRETPETYGEFCAPYFLKLLNEVKQGDH